MSKFGASDHKVLLPAAHPAMVFAPSHLCGPAFEVRVGDVVMRTDLGVTQPREEAFGLTSGGLAVGIRFTAIDAFRQMEGVLCVSMQRFVGLHDCMCLHALADGRA